MSTRELVSLPPILPFSPDPSHPHGDGFYFGIQFQCVVTHLAVVAAEGQCGVEDVVAVDPDFHRCCDDVLMARRGLRTYSGLFRRIDCPVGISPGECSAEPLCSCSSRSLT